MRAGYLDASAPFARERGGGCDAGSRLLVGRQARGGRGAMTLAGEIDLRTAPLVRAALEECLASGVRVIEVDLSAVGFCDCSGLSVFLQVSQRAAAAGGCLRLRRPQPAVARLFALSDTDALLLGCRLAIETPAPAPSVHGAPG